MFAETHPFEPAAYLKALGVKKVGILVEDSAAGSSSSDAMCRELSAAGMEIVSEQVFSIRTTDMTPFLRKLRSDGAMAIDSHISNNSDVTQYLIGLSRLRWQPISVGHTGLLFGGTPGAVPADTRFKDVYAATFRALTYTDADQPSPRVVEFAEKIISTKVPDTLFGPAVTSPFYDFIIAIKTAAERASSLDPDVIKAALDDRSPGLLRVLGHNERLVALALQGRRNEALLSSKFGYVRAENGGLGVCETPDFVRKSCEASLRRLETDHIDLYFQHRLDPDVPIEDTVGAMAGL